MPEKNSSKRLDQLSRKLAFLQKIVFFQNAVVAGLQDYVLLKAPDPESAHSELKKLVLNIYDQHIEDIEKRNPADAANIDIRPDLDEDEQFQWYFPESSE